MPSSPNYYGGFRQRKSPWSTNEERLVDEALARALGPRENVQGAIAPLWQVDPWRPRMGYEVHADRQPTVEDALGSSRYYPDRRLDFSGSAGSYSGYNRPAMGANPY